MLTRRFSPPLMPFKSSSPTKTSAQSLNPIFSNTSSALFTFSSLLIDLGSLSPAANLNVSRTVKYGNSALSSCVTYEHSDRASLSVGWTPLNNIVPEVWYLVLSEERSRRAMVLSNDDFPLPEGPRITFNSPARNVVETPLSTSRVLPFPGLTDASWISSARSTNSTSTFLTSSPLRFSPIISFPAEASGSSFRVRTAEKCISTVQK